jgi:hypothetical protein
LGSAAAFGIPIPRSDPGLQEEIVVLSWLVEAALGLFASVAPELTPKDVETLVRTVYGEARGSTQEDRIAVAWVIKNRAAQAQRFVDRNGKPHPLFGNGSAASACLVKWQFSCWNPRDPNRDQILKVRLPKSLGEDVVKRCYDAIVAVWIEAKVDPTRGSTHYHTLKSGWPQSWGERREPAVIIGAHAFYNDVR